MNNPVTASTLATVFAAASAFLVFAAVTVAAIVGGVAGYGCW